MPGHDALRPPNPRRSAGQESAKARSGREEARDAVRREAAAGVAVDGVPLGRRAESMVAAEDDERPPKARPRSTLDHPQKGV
jgi:hypothetical protein